MKKTLHLLVFVLALATAIALAQTSSSGTSTQTPTATPSTSSDQSPAAVPASQDMDRGKDKGKDKTKSKVDDSTLDRQIKDQLSTDSALKNVQASVDDGVVKLEGTVASKADKKRAKQMVASIPGVRKVHDKLKVEASATAAPGSNEPASASANTAGSISGNASASSTTPQTPSASASGSTTTREPGASGLPQSDVSAGAASQTQSNTGVSGTTPSTLPQSSTTGAAGASGTTSTSTTAGTTGTTGTTTGASDLQTQCETALQREPTLSGSHINCVVSGDTIELSGSVMTGKERQTALRIAHSYAGNRRVVDRLTVTGRGQGANMGGETPERDRGTGNTSNPSSTPNNPTSSPESTNNPR